MWIQATKPVPTKPSACLRLGIAPLVLVASENDNDKASRALAELDEFGYPASSQMTELTDG